MLPCSIQNIRVFECLSIRYLSICVFQPLTNAWHWHQLKHPNTQELKHYMKSNIDRQQNIQLVFLVCALVLIAKAAQLQIFDDSFRRRADATTIENLTVYPPRGLVYDRNGLLIINNEATYDLMVTYNQVTKTMNVAKFCGILGITESDFKQYLTKDWRSGKFSRSVPFVFLKKLAPQTYHNCRKACMNFPVFLCKSAIFAAIHTKLEHTYWVISRWIRAILNGPMANTKRQLWRRWP